MDLTDISWRTAVLFSLTAPAVFAAVLIAVRGHDRRAALTLAALIGAASWHAIPYIIGFEGAYDAYPWLTFAPFNMELLFGPLIYLHARAIARRGPAPHQALWLTPAAVQVTYYTACFVLLGDAETKFAFTRAFHHPYVVPVETVVGLGLALAGALAARRETLGYRTWLATAHAAADEYDPVWLRRFLAVAAVMVATWLAFDVWDALAGGLRYVQTYWLYIAFAVVVLALSFDGLTRVHARYPKRPADPDARAETSAAAGGLTADMVLSRMREHGWHRDPDLSLARLAKHLGANETYVSRAINAGGETFNTVINRMRVAEVAARLADPTCSTPILTLAYEAGFASKATFNRVYRSITGETPSRTRANARLNAASGVVSTPSET